MIGINRPLTEAEYEEIKNFSHKEIYDWLEAKLPASIRFGNGFYGCSNICTEKDGTHYLSYHIGDSCD